MKSETVKQFESSLMNSLNNSPIFHLHDCGLESNYKLYYLKHIYIDGPQPDGSSDFSGFSKEYSKSGKIEGEVAIKVMTHVLEVPEDGNVYEFTTNEGYIDEINKDAVDLIYKHSIENSSKLDKAITSLEVDKDNSIVTYRRIISKILALSNVIATNHRRGPGSYVILSEEVYDIIKESNPVFYTSLYKPSDNVQDVAGLLFYCSDKLLPGEVIIGRKGKSDEPGLHMTSSDAIIINHFSENIDEAKVKLRYKLDVVDSLAAYYLKIKFS